MLRVFVDPLPKLGIAMRRTAWALRATCPQGVTVVNRPEDADIQVLHAVGRDVRKYLKAPQYAVMMHCLDFEADPRGNGDNIRIERASVDEPWQLVWRDALLVWSYYDLTTRPFTWGSVSSQGPGTFTQPQAAPHFYSAPLGVDGRVFTKTKVGNRPTLCLTSGYVSGPHAEAIEEIARAAVALGQPVVHLGPNAVGGMAQGAYPGWSSVTGIDDGQLAGIYNDCRWVAGLRHGEGFELPVLEGLACGARPIVFDLPCYRRWFGDHAAFVPECHGDDLVREVAAVFARPARPVLPAERQTVLDAFNWETIGVGFWRGLLATYAAQQQQTVTVAGPGHSPGLWVAPTSPSLIPGLPSSVAPPRIEIPPGQRPRIVWVGDSPTRPWTGFGRASRHILARLAQEFDVTAIGTTHDGAPYHFLPEETVPYPVWPFTNGNEMIARVVSRVQPSVVLLQHDPWQVQVMRKAIGDCPVIGIMPIDGKNCRTDYLNGLTLAVWWTEWAKVEAANGGFYGPSTVIPLGVDLDIYHPIDRTVARASIGWPERVRDGFVVGYVARNQHRKRMDLALAHFAGWIKERGIEDAYLLISAAPTGEAAYHVDSYAAYYGIQNKFLHYNAETLQAAPESRLAVLYAALDVFWSTTQGEGFGLPALEAMACGVPCVLPDWAAYGDWAAPAAHLVPVGDIAGTMNTVRASGVTIGVLGAVPDRTANIAALDRLYHDAAYRATLRANGLALSAAPQFRWAAIGERFADAVRTVLTGPVLVGDAGISDHGRVGSRSGAPAPR